MPSRTNSYRTRVNLFPQPDREPPTSTPTRSRTSERFTRASRTGSYSPEMNTRSEKSRSVNGLEKTATRTNFDPTAIGVSH